ncbi:phage tail X [Nitrobacter hamburgensis X14]|uniref:Phage tail X n=1 Tax=Nitrobacter hamburgensis (strain DSM 10229 / NCIMB 13809 / X14) TaxID=323097 RepID=Q1QI95_NITHX|nr:tail protein X [Nitrobacter hamburgensis]ABE64052.1 phage tail X [Nitrobacter hamburgensis X14]
MATVYTTMQGEMVDMICRRVYGDESGYVELVLDLNPGLAAAAIPLPIGTTIMLPDLPRAAPERKIVSLWD